MKKLGRSRAEDVQTGNLSRMALLVRKLKLKMRTKRRGREKRIAIGVRRGDKNGRYPSHSWNSNEHHPYSKANYFNCIYRTHYQKVGLLYIDNMKGDRK
ncbi:hypothetical protein WR25_03382 [Diploscapter pachys]|uniref:Uncharacterized protein n=1 Tax=Diploscapter pachys TaxID=2018661 RepID=A0A2A2LLQ8_9BILA|nr:hypothetical protein WR25_03382 [Diploscapter pachys]